MPIQNYLTEFWSKPWPQTFASIGAVLFNIISKFMEWGCHLSHPPHSPTYMCQWTWSALVQKMAFCLIGTKLLYNPSWLIVNWTFRNGTNFSEILIKIQNFSFTKMHLKISSVKCWPFCPGEDELSWWHGPNNDLKQGTPTIWNNSYTTTITTWSIPEQGVISVCC